MRDQRIPALSALTLALLTAWSPAVYSAGLGAIRVQSSLGQPLRVAIPLQGEDVTEVNVQCIKARLDTADGVYLMNPRVSMGRLAQGVEIQLATNQNINEPALSLQVNVACGMQLQRSYQLLLDPVVILPQTGLAEPPVSTARTNRQSRASLPAIAPSPVIAGASDQQAVRKKERRKNSRAESAENQGSDMVKSPRMAIAKELGGKKVVRSVLKLSSDEGTPEGMAFSPGLKLSDELSESRDTGDPKQTAELRAAQQRMAAILRDEDPVQKSEQELKSVQARLQELEKENARIKQQGQEQQSEMEGMRREMFSGRWIAWLILLLLVAASAIGWLFWRLRTQARTKPAAFWEKTIGPDESDADDWDEELLTSTPDSTLVRAAADDDAEDDDLDSISPDWEKGISVEETVAPGRGNKQFREDAGLDRKPVVQPASEDKLSIHHGQETSAQTKGNRPVASQSQTAQTGTAAPRTVAASRKHDTPELPQLEEISDLMQEAEFWMLLNDAPRAIEILEPCLNIEHPASPVPWIYLLDLYHVMKERKKYEALSARIKHVFNTNAPEWSEDTPDAAIHGLKNYPHVVATIEELWEGNQIIPYLEGLLVDERDGAREGFDLAVYREIIHLISLAREPDIAKRRASLHIGKPQPRLLSQQVTSDPPLGQTAADELPDLDIFDKATSSQATARQVVPKPAVLKAPAAAVFKPPSPEAGMPMPGATAPMQSGKTAEPTPAIENSPVPPLPLSKPEPETQPAAVASSAEVPAFLVAPQAHSVANPAVAPAGEEVNKQGIDEDEELASDMATKLDLAVAYQEIGEHVGARVLLEEVIQGGSPIQAEKAKAMLKKLLKEIDWL